MKRLIPILFMIACLGVSMQSKAQSCSDVPVINSFEPNTGFIGSLVTVYGANFDASTIENNVVYFGATQAEVVSATFGTLEVIVPVGASTAPISVTNACELTAYSKVAFNGVFCPTPLDAQSYDNRAFDLTGVYGAYNMISQDMDLDGRPEVISSRNDGGVTIAQNNSTPGNLSFTAINDATGGGQSVYAADFDGDGYKDLLYTYNVQRNTSTGPGNISLAPIISNNSISNYQVAAGDFNNDGKIDIIGAVGNDVYLALNTSTGPGVISFAPRQFIANVGATPTGLQIADIDGDGKVDYIASQRFGNRAVSMRNTTTTGSTTTSWEAPEYWASDSDATDGLGTEPYRSQLADFDKDGKIDFTSCNYAGTTNTAIWRNISTVGNIEFAPTVNLPAPANNYRIGVGDVDGDGYPDIVTKSLGLNVFSVYRNTSSAPGEPTFAPRIDYTSSWQAEVSGIVIGDLDGDFVPDIATSGINSNRILFHRNTSAQEDTSPPTAIAQDIVVGLDPSGNVTVTASQVDNGSSDACGIDTIELSQTAFTCADIGENNVTLTVTDNAGNVSTADAIVNVQPAAIIVSGQTTVCQGETIPMTANDGDAYQWYKDGEIIAGATSQVYSASETGAYTVDVTNAGGCSGTSLATDITIQGSSSVEVTVSNETYCPGSTTLTASQSALYQWALDGVDIPDATLQTLIAVGPGVYSVRVVDLFGCSASGTATVLADTQAPVATLNGAAVMNLIQGDVFVDEGVSVVDNCETTVLVTGVVDTNNVGVYTISYVAEDGSGNTSNTLTREVTVLPASISIQANGETEFCPGGTVELSFNDLTTNTLLDNATVAPQLALGFRKLIGTYNGPAVRLRRSSDNQEQDFGFSGVDLDINAIETFLNGSTGYATILYDQSGNNNHMTQASQSIQPLFVKDGFNGKPMLNTFGAKRMMNTINLVAEFTVVYGARQVGPRRGRMLSGVYNNWLLGWWNGYKSQYYSQGWVAGPYGTGSNNNAYVYSGTGKQSTDTYAAYENGVLLASNTGGSQGPSGLHIGAGGTNGYEPSDGYFTDLVAYNTVLSTEDRELVESIIGSYNGIYGEAPQTVAAYEPTLQWSRDGSAIDGATDNTFVASESGNYLVEANINGNVIASNSIEVISEDLEAPVLTLTGADQTIELGDSYAEQGATVTDNCDTPEVVIGGDNVNTGVVGTYLVTYDATDASGNQAIQLIRTVTVQDLTRPVAIAKDVVVELDENGNATITADQVNNGSTDASGDLTLSLDQTTFDCDDVGAEQAAEYGVLLDGKNDFINMGSFNGALNNTSEATYQIWVNMLSLSGAYNSIVEAQHTSGTGYLSLEYDNVNRKLGVWVTGGNVLTQNSVIDLNQWVNITAVFNGNLPQQDRVKVYIDGVDQPMANSTITSSTATDIGDLIIGSQFGTTQFSNIIYDEVRIWGKALSPQEVADNWNQTIVGDEAGLLGYYSFEDGPGSSTVTELTGNQGQAMLNNMDPNTAWVEGANGLSQGATGVQVTLTVTDGSNNSSTATALVTVEDNIHPVLVGIPADVTVECDAVPDVAVVTATDNCGTPLVTFSEERIDGISNNNYTLIRSWTTVDGSGNTASGTQIITVEDNIAPTLVGIPADVTVECDAVPAVAAVSATDNCGANPLVTFYEERIDGISDNNYTLTRTWTTTDESGNTASVTQIITVEDNIDPTITINGDALVFHDAYTAYIDSGATATDNCGDTELSVDSTVDADMPGAYTVTYTATDASGNEATATRTVIVRDITAPQVVVQPTSTSLDASGNASITIDDVVASTTDDSGTVNVSVSDSDFACVDLGDNTVSITGEDLNGNSLGLTTDGLIGYWKFGGANPLVDLTGNWGDIELMHGATINNGALDVNPGNFARTTGYHGTENITSKTLISYVSIQNLNVRSGSAMSIDGVSNDNFDAIVYAERQVFRWMNGSSNFRRTQDLNPGFAETEANQRVQMAITYEVVNGQVNITVYRNGIQIGAYSDPDDTFWTPNNVEILFGTRHSSGNNPIGGLDARVEKALIYNRALSAQEIAAMNGTPVTVAVVDEIAPTIPTVADISVFATSAAGAVVNYDTPVGVDNCSATTLLTEGLASGETFPIGITTVSYTVTDLSGNSAVTTFNVDVSGIAPEIVVPEAITVSNDAGACGAIVSYAATETLGIPASVITYDIAPGSSFAVGTATVTATATNAVGVSSKTFTVTVEDTEAPNAMAQDFSVDLDANGVAEIIIADINAGSDDNCGIAEIRLDKTSFDCSNVGTNTVTLTVIDIHDNISEVTATVTVSDVTAPVIEVTPISVNLDENGNYSLDPGNLLEDRVSALVRQREIARTERRLALYQRRLLHLERRVAAYEARLASLNEELTQATTDEDRARIQEMIESVTTSLSEARDAVNESMLTMEEVQQTLDALLNVPVLGTVDDACGIESIVASQLDFDCNHIGDNTIVLIVTDVNANVSTAEVVVTVNDVTVPNVLVQSIQISLDAFGQAVITPADIDAGSNDACGIKSLSLDITSFDCSDIGANTVTLTVTDNNENVSVAQATVTISDITPAEVLTQDFRVELDANGTAAIVVGDIDAGSNDACGIDTMELDRTTFDCTNVGPNTVTLTVTDVNGNVSDATAIVTVVDVIAPTVTTKNITVALDENGEYTITPQDVNDGSFDNCTFSLSLDNNSFDCNTLGENTVMLTATDASNNSTTVAATVTVIDNAAPTIVANNIEVQLDENGEASITVSDVDGGTYDNCAVATVSIDVNSFNCDNLGENTVTITATDVNGNTSTGPAIVTVVDVIAPTVGTRNISVELDDNGNVNITPEEVLILSEDDLETGEDCTVSAAQYHAMWLSKYVKEKGYGKNKGSYKGKGKKKGHYYSKYKDTRFVFDANGGSISRNLDGTATVTGTLVSTQDPDDQWTVSLNLENARNWSEWSALGRSYKDEKRLAGERYLDWTYYEMAADSKLIGAGNNTGEEVALTHAPTDYRYGFQLGDAANSKNGNFGMSGWFFYTNRDGKQVQGDFNLDVADCADQPLPAGSVITSDNCSIVSYELDITSFDCTNLGENTVQVTVTDQSGNATTESATVTVSDNIAPVAVATNITVSLGEDGTVVVDASELDGGSTDNTDCPLTFTLSQNTFDCNDIGKGSYYQDDHSCDDDRHRHKKGKGHYNYKGKGYGHRKGSRKKGHRVTLTVTDAAGNSSTANAYITVVDDLAPVISADPVTIVVYDRRKEYLKKYDVEPRVTDNCEVYKVYFPRTRFDRNDAGMNTVMVTATDKSGNTVTGPLNVNVIDISSYGKRVTMCYRGRTYRVSKYKVQYYLRKGASLGTCSTDITMAVGGSDLNQTIGEREVDWEPLIELGAYPNPSRGMTTITFSSEEAGPAQMAVVNAAGVPMATLYDGNIEAEENVKVTYNTSELPSGMYIIRLVTAGKVKNLKLMVKK